MRMKEVDSGGMYLPILFLGEGKSEIAYKEPLTFLSFKNYTVYGCKKVELKRN